MTPYRYQPGDRPLEGFTIDRAAGRGGFGEVYFAHSDSGREVALKVVQAFEAIELRGISHCMNLKSQHLVTIFDIRKNTQGVPFVVMEFVNGPSLRDIIDQSPGGLGVAKSAFILRELAKGMAALHDCGIVHRDLKPGNVFIENGIVKIGDYGLSKAISSVPNVSQTITVGSVHYMAPEIGAGKYDKSIDIYALGILLYEMLTGQVPYFGQTPGEVLMKHLTVEPDLSMLPEPFKTAVHKSIAKNPLDRFQNVQQVVECVFGSDEIRSSMAGFDVADLSMVAGRIGEKIVVPAGMGGSSGATPTLPYNDPSSHIALTAKAERITFDEDEVELSKKEQKRRLRDSLRATMAQIADAKRDPVSGGLRLIMTTATVVVLGIAIGVGAGRNIQPSGDIAGVASACVLFLGGANAGLWLARATVMRKLLNETLSTRRLAVGTMAVLPALITGGWLALAFNLSHGLHTGLLGAIISIVMIDWFEATGAERRNRLEPQNFFYAGGLGWLFAMLGHWVFQWTLPNVWIAAGLPIALAVTAQILAGWDPSVSMPLKDDVKTLRGALERLRDRAKRSREQPYAANAAAVGVTDAVTNMFRPPSPPTPVEVTPLPPPVISAPAKRQGLIALVLAAIPAVGVPFCGLHRFYVGRTASGIVWLLTYGLFGIGQIVDVILLLCGRFKDASGRPVSVFGAHHDSPAPAAASGASRRLFPTAFQSLCALLGGLMFFGVVALGVLNASTVLDAMASGEISTGVLTSQTTRTYDSGNRHVTITGPMMSIQDSREAAQVAQMGVSIAAGGLALLGGLLLMVSRRSQGANHMIRSLVAAALLMGAFAQTSRLIARTPSAPGGSALNFDSLFGGATSIVSPTTGESEQAGAMRWVLWTLNRSKAIQYDGRTLTFRDANGRVTQFVKAEESFNLADARQIQERYLAAVGGRATLAQVRTRVTTGTLSYPALDVSGDYLLHQTTSAAVMRADLASYGEITQGYAGDVVWRKNDPAAAAKIINGDEAELIRQSLSLTAEIDDPFFEHVSEQEVVNLDGELMHRLRATLPSGLVETRFYSLSSNLLVRSEARRSTPQKFMQFVTYYEEYKRFGKLLLPATLRTQAGGVEAVLTIASVQDNAAIAADRVAMPAEIASVVSTREALKASLPWTRIGHAFRDNRPAEATRLIIDAFDAKQSANLLILFVASMLVLAWPPKQPRALV